MNKTIVVSFIAIIGFILVSLIILAAYRAQDIKYRCSQFQTREIAEGYYRLGNAQYLDRDGDGIPCEHLK